MLLYYRSKMSPKDCSSRIFPTRSSGLVFVFLGEATPPHRYNAELDRAIATLQRALHVSAKLYSS